MITLISPAKTLDFESEIISNISSNPIFTAEPQRITKKLKSLSRKKIAGLMSLSEKLADLNYQRYQMWAVDPEDDLVRQAVLMFKGEVYLGLDPYSFSVEDTEQAQKIITYIIRTLRLP